MEMKYQKYKNIGDETRKYVLFNMIETVYGFKIAASITLVYILNILTLNCLLIKWLNGDIIDHLFHFIHDNHDHKFDNANSSTLAYLHHNSESLNLTDKFDVIKFEFTDSTFNLNEFLLNIFIFLLTLLIFLCKFNNMKANDNYENNLSSSSSCNEPQIICNNTVVNNDEGFKIEIRSMNRNFKNTTKLSKLSKVLFTILLYVALFLVIYLSLSFDSIQLVVKCERFFKYGFHMVSNYF
jgi:hypothetical protein